jgi:hypothetical protein
MYVLTTDNKLLEVKSKRQLKHVEVKAVLITHTGPVNKLLPEIEEWCFTENYSGVEEILQNLQCVEDIPQSAHHRSVGV